MRNSWTIPSVTAFDDDKLAPENIFIMPSRTFRVRFADGTGYMFVAASATDLIFSPLFLKYFLNCVLIFAVLQQRDDVAILNAWEMLALWLAIAGAAILWLCLVISFTIWLRDRRIINSIYTPFITVSTIVFSEPALQIMLHNFLNAPPDYDYIRLEYMLQPMVVIFLMDMSFGNFVAPLHPAFIPDPKTRARNDASLLTHSAVEPFVSKQALVVEDTKTPEPVDDNQSPPQEQTPSAMLLLNDQKVKVTEILIMQIEDHYLRVTTINENILTRYKMSAAVNEIHPDIGYQINRSVWVAKAAIAKVNRTPSYGAEVVLKSGATFNVSRSRMSGVLEQSTRWGIVVGRSD